MNAVRPTDDDDVRSAAPPVLVRAAGGILALAGSITVLTGVQVLLASHVHGSRDLGPWVLIGIGVLTTVMAIPASRARFWAVLASLVLASIDLLIVGQFVITSIARGFYSCFAIVAVIVTAAAVVAAILSLAAARRASAARARMKQRGESFGI